MTRPQRRPRFLRTAVLTACLAAAGAFTLARAADSPAEQPIQAVRLQPDEHIVLDGTLAHPAWQRAPVFERTYVIQPVRGVAPTHNTQVQVLYDDKALYVGVTALDPEPQRIRAPLVRHDQVNRTQDFVVLYVDPIGARKAAQFFRVSASGSTGDGLHTAANDSEDFSPDFDFDSAVSRHDKGYTVVFRVPYSSLRYTARSGSWRLMVGRRIPRENVTLTLTVPLPQEALSFIDMLQPLQGFEPPVDSNFLQVRPTLTLRRTDDRPHDAPRDTASEAKASLDLKWRPRPELVLDATINPDFSQVALDEPQLSRNTRFALFLTEKRPFFLESSDLLVSPTDALYMRSINDPRWGVRGTWRGEGLTAAALALRDKGGGLTPIPGAYGTGFALQPANDAVMSRGLWHLGSVSLGGIVAGRRYDDAAGGSAGDNMVAGADGQWLITDSWRLKAQAMGSRTTAFADPEGVLRQGAARRGGLAYLDLYGRTDNSETDVSYQEISEGFRNDAGFVAQAGIRKLVANHGHQWFSLGPFNQVNLYLNTQRTEERSTGQAVLQRWVPGLWVAGAHNSEAMIELVPDEKLRVRAGAPLQQARYVHLWGETTPAEWVPLAEAWFDTGRMVDVSANADGRVVSGRKFGVDIQTRPLRWLELHPRLEALVLDNPVEGRYEETAVQLLGVWHVAARQSVRLILQRRSFERAGSGKDAETAQSLTYAWRRSAGTVLYVGATRGATGLPAAPSRSTEVFAKLQFDLGELHW
ncbi:carbohydrate binding family 9 domain-containing protein [Ideonella sp. BN130291]|uniref:carbohydrate binding family 9 domain-containing protein n=1 Tax=Ideonella sp. BN130291 TaxID=3112940 RepID=UPI002E26A119|nr:DUF5916 domain-containing protein [Ideonella sp. BN130291]